MGEQGTTFGHRPKSLFRYQRFNEWLRAIIVESQLYFPDLKELNDPCELCYHIDVTWDDEMARRQVEHIRSMHYPTTAVERANPSIDVRAITVTRSKCLTAEPAGEPPFS